MNQTYQPKSPTFLTSKIPTVSYTTPSLRVSWTVEKNAFFLLMKERWNVWKTQLWLPQIEKKLRSQFKKKLLLSNNICLLASSWLWPEKIQQNCHYQAANEQARSSFKKSLYWSKTFWSEQCEFQWWLPKKASSWKKYYPAFLLRQPVHFRKWDWKQKGQRILRNVSLFNFKRIFVQWNYYTVFSFLVENPKLKTMRVTVGCGKRGIFLLIWSLI